MKVFFKRLFLLLSVLFLTVCALVVYLFETASDGIPVLNYHQINNTAHNPLTVNVEQFDKQMAYLADNGYTAITPTEMLDAWERGIELPENPVIITFDDGYVDNYENAYPILKKYGLKGSLFVITDYVDTYPNYVTWKQLHEMNQSGVIDVEAHTLSHVTLTDVSIDEAAKQLGNSKAALEMRLGKPINFVAYPCGAYNEEIENLTKALNYRGAFTVNYGLAKPSDEPFILDRIPIFGSNNHTFLRFKLRLACTPLFHPLNILREQLLLDGHPILANFILIP